MSSIWNYGNEVVGNDRHVMAIHAELLHALCPSIDQAQSMCFAWSELKTAEASITHARGGISSSDCGAIEVISPVD